MKRYTFAGIVAALATAGLLAVNPVSAGASTAPRCHTEQLHLSVTLNGAAAGSTYYRVQFTNETAAPCSLYGWPGVSFMDAAKRRLGWAATFNASYPPARVTLRPGATAMSLLSIVNPDNYPVNACKPARSSFIRVYPPNAYKAITHRMRVTVCMARPVLAVTPVSG